MLASRNPHLQGWQAETFTRADMLATHADDAATCAWLATAKLGEVLEQMHAEQGGIVSAPRKRQPVGAVTHPPNTPQQATGCRLQIKPSLDGRGCTPAVPQEHSGMAMRYALQEKAAVAAPSHQAAHDADRAVPIAVDADLSGAVLRGCRPRCRPARCVLSVPT